MSRDDEDFQWLREQVERDEILALFSEDSDTVKVAVRRLVARAQEDASVEAELIDTLEMAIDQGSDDSDASIWIAVVLGETRSSDAIGVLSRCLAWEGDETLQDAAQVALLRIGEPAINAIIEGVDEGRGTFFARAAYRFLGETGLLGDDLISHIGTFIEERLTVESRVAPKDSALESLIEAAARLGQRGMLPVLKKILARKFRGNHPLIEDAIESLEENVDGVAFVPTTPPWEERYGWIFEAAEENIEVRRNLREGS